MSGLLGFCFLMWLMWFMWFMWFISGLLGLCILLVYGPNLMLGLVCLVLCLWCLLLDVLDLVGWWLHPCCGGSTLLGCVITSLSSVTSMTDSISSGLLSVTSMTDSLSSGLLSEAL